MPDNASTGAMPAAAGATPVQITPVSPAADPATTPATGDDGLGDSGKRALDSERATARAEKARADKAEKALADFEAKNATEAEKALKAAKDEGAGEVRTVLTGLLRQAKVEVALAAAGINPSVIDLASKAPEFAALTVKDDGTVEGLTEAVVMFKGTRGDLFKPAQAGGTADLGTGSGTRSAAGKTFTREQLRDPEFYRANKADIMQAMQEGRITG